MSHPFIPMLRLNPILPYDPAAWCCNFIWLHKQPLFLWQMALSMKLFGVNLLALRLPSLLMGTVAVYFVYDIALRWTRDRVTALLAAVLYAFSYFQLELTSGLFSLDHNDAAFAFYVTGSFWAFVRYYRSGRLKWAVLAGLFSGAAILNKWLPGLLVYAGWGLLFVLEPGWLRSRLRWRHLGWSVLAAVAVFLPWQLYIWWRFPAEAAISYRMNTLHMMTALEGHTGPAGYHLRMAGKLYGRFILPFLLPGLWLALAGRERRNLTAAFVFCIAVIYLFFSLLVKTKMPAFPFPVGVLVFILIAAGLVWVFRQVAGLLRFPASLKRAALGLLFALAAVYTLKPWQIRYERRPDNTDRNARIHDTEIFRSLPDSVVERYVIFNCNSFEDVELMFWRGGNAYHWWPEQAVWDSLKQAGCKLAAFESHGEQQLPAYILNDPDALIIHRHLARPWQP